MTTASKVIANVLVNASGAIKGFQEFAQAGKDSLEELAGSAREAGKEISAAMDDAGKSLKSFSDTTHELGASLAKIGGILTATVTAPLLAVAGAGTAAWNTQIEAATRLETVIKSTGGAAGKTAEELKKTAGEIQDLTRFGDEAVMEMQALLLTFTQVKGDVFDDASMAIANMASALGTDLRGEVMRVGRAMQDPVQGMTALTRAGVVFTDAQKDMAKAMVESGNIVGAQKVILAELEVQFGGMAEAMARVGSGPMIQAWNKVGDVMEEIGKIVEPVVHFIADAIKAAAQAFLDLDDSTKTFIVYIGAAAAAIGPMLVAIGVLMMSIGPLISLLGLLVVGLKGLLIATAVGAVIAGLAYLIYQNWDGIVAATTTAFNLVSSIITGVFEGLTAIADGAVSGMTMVWTGFSSFFSALWEGLKAIGTGAWSVIAAAGTGALEAIKTAWSLLGSAATIVIDAIKAAWTGLIGFFAGLWEDIVAVATSAWDGIVAVSTAIVDGIKGAWEGITSWFADLWDSAVAGVKKVWDDFLSWFQGTIVGKFIKWIGDAISAIDRMISALRRLISTQNQAQASGSGGGGYAQGGYVWGPGTSMSDSINARLSAGEFVIRAAAVRKYGARFFRMLNGMAVNGRELLQGFNMGGLVGMPQPMLAFAGGNSVPQASGEQMSILHLTIDGYSFGELLAPRETADRIIQFSTDEQVRSNGPKPWWYR